ncbi:MAG: hypothetical protein GY757_53010 [bacterium]|nr:hypothetical protein [bacterium]
MDFTPKTKQGIVVVIAIIVVVIVSLLLYHAKDRSAKSIRSNKIEKRELDLDKNVFDEGIFKKTQNEIQIISKRVDAQNKIIDNLKGELAIVNKKVDIKQKSKGRKIPELPRPPTREEVVRMQNRTNHTPPPQPPPVESKKTQMQNNKTPVKSANQRLFKSNSRPTPTPPPRSGGKSRVGKKGVGKKGDNWAGGITKVSCESCESKAKEKKKKIYLPPSHMEACLLSGLVAPTTTSGNTKPVPMLIRINDLAFLPNEMKADLEGCFIIGEGVGNLAMERVESRTVTLSCLAKGGKSVIDQPLRGFLADSDGTIGLKGRVVMKAGLHLARVALAGFVEGIGKALSDSVMDTNIGTNTGLVQRTMQDDDQNTYLKAGFGAGIENVSQELVKFYLRLAEQTVPVIEVGATKKCTVIVLEGTELIVKEY